MQVTEIEEKLQYQFPLIQQVQT